MKRILFLISLFCVLVISGCGCDKDKASLQVGDMNATSYKTITMMELNTKIEDGDSFVLYVYSTTCGGCDLFKPIIENVIVDRHLIVYAIEYNNISNDHELSGLKYTPSLVVYDEGDLLIKVDPDSNAKYFENYDGFKSFLDKYTYMPTMYYINLEQLNNKINNKESFIIYYSRNDCSDCSYVDKHYLQDFLEDNYNNKSFYVIETNVEGIRLKDGVVNDEQWNKFKKDYGLSKEGNSTHGYGVGYVPTFQYYSEGVLSKAAIYFNDDMEFTQNPDGSYNVKINGSYYSDNPYIGQTMPYSEYHDKLDDFYEEKLDAFFDEYLRLVD